MEELDVKELVIKIINYWNKNDGKEFDVKELKENFSLFEIAAILFNKEIIYQQPIVIERFKEKISKINNLITEQEADLLYNSGKVNSDYLLKYVSKDKRISIIKDNIDIFVAVSSLSSDEERISALNQTLDDEFKYYIISDFESDELKIKYLSKVEPSLRANLINTFSSDENKIKYLNIVPISSRSTVIASFEDDNLKEKYLNIFKTNKGDIIESLSSDEKKVYYLKKFFAFLSNEDKGRIIASIKDDNKFYEQINICSTKVKEEMIYYIKDENRQEFLLRTTRNKKFLCEVLESNTLDNNLVIKYIDQITNTKDILAIINQLDDEARFACLKNIIKNNKKVVFDLIEHCEYFPKYSDEYEYLIDFYSNAYNVNKERLIQIADKTSLFILKVIKNNNILKILNSSEDEFNKIIQIFDKNQLQMDRSSINDIINSIIQRQFRINYNNIIQTFPSLLNYIEIGNREEIIKILNEIIDNIDIKDEFKEYSSSVNQFVSLLLNKDEKAIDCLHNITNKYVKEMRNKYLQEKMQPTLEEIALTTYDSNDLIKYIVKNYPVELIESIFPKKNSPMLSDEENLLINDRQLLKDIISFKKEPSKFPSIPENIKRNIRQFNSILEKSLSNYSIKKFCDISIENKTYSFGYVNSEFLVNILMNIDIDKASKGLFNNDELYGKFIKLWKQYKLGGWGTYIKKEFNKSGIVIDAETIANFIQYFGLSYTNLQEKVQKGDLANISITSLLDLSNCYSSESIKYSKLFGNENFRFIASNPGPNASTMLKEKRIEKAVELLTKIRKRKTVAVPPLDSDFDLSNGKKINIVVGNFSNPITITYGERTGSCMRIGGAGESLFDFCLENNNGFHIRFTNPKTGLFVSRVSGFRNGNTVFLNELRFSEDSSYTDEDVVEACKLVSDRLIELSKNSQFPIDNVVISPYYAMKDSKASDVSLNVSDVQEGLKHFYTDVSSHSKLLSSSSPDKKLMPVILNANGVPKYPVQRDKKRFLYNNDAQEYLLHLQSLDELLKGKNVDEINVEKNQNIISCIAGEDWCVTIDKDQNIENFIMNNSNNKELAFKEVQEVLLYLKDNLVKEITISKNMTQGM